MVGQILGQQSVRPDSYACNLLGPDVMLDHEFLQLPHRGMGQRTGRKGLDADARIDEGPRIAELVKYDLRVIAADG